MASYFTVKSTDIFCSAELYAMGVLLAYQNEHRMEIENNNLFEKNLKSLLEEF